MNPAKTTNEMVRLTLSTMQSDIGHMLVTGSGKILKLSNVPRPTPDHVLGGKEDERKLLPDDIEQLAKAKNMIDKEIMLAYHEAISDHGMETICDCSVHIQCLQEVRIQTLQDFACSDPLVLKFALRRAERLGARPQLHLYVCLMSKAKIVGVNLAKFMVERDPVFPLRESQRRA